MVGAQDTFALAGGKIMNRTAFENFLIGFGGMSLLFVIAFVIGYLSLKVCS